MLPIEDPSCHLGSNSDFVFALPEPPSGFNPSVEVVGLFCAYQDQYLLVRRSPTESHPGTWCFPGGKVEPGEPLDAAIIREMREETGLHFTTDQLEPAGTIYIRRTSFDFPFHLFHAELSHRPTIQLNAESDASHWTPLDRAHELPLISAGREVIDFFLSQQLRI
jgi:8-oxo-dGTP diphosphatase